MSVVFKPTCGMFSLGQGGEEVFGAVDHLESCGPTLNLVASP